MIYNKMIFRVFRGLITNVSWLCLVFLSTFFVGCKPQEQPSAPVNKKNETTKKVVQKTDFVAEEIPSESFVQEEPVLIKRKKDNSVIITAVLEDAPEEINKLSAKIELFKGPYKDTETIVKSTVVSENRIVFSAISAGLKKLRVSVCSENFPKCYSEEFSTTDGEDKEINVEIPLNVTLKGTAFLPDGSPVKENLTISVFPADESKGRHQSGVVSSKLVQPETDGSYKLSNLVQGIFNIKFSIPGYKLIKTNLFLAPSETELDISFSENPAAKISGVVIYEADNNPAEGITINARTWRDNPVYAFCVTDKDGKFSLKLHEWHPGFFGVIDIEEQGFGKVVKQIDDGCKFIKIVLRQAGNIEGKIMTEDGELLPGIEISINYIKKRRNIKKISPDSNMERISYKTISDSHGKFKFSNVVAPAKYGFEIIDTERGFSLPLYYNGKGFTVEVEPEKIAECDLIVQRNAVIALKAKEKNGNPILKYKIRSKIKFKDSVSTLHYYIDVSEDEWYYIRPMHSGAGIFSCFSEENDKNINFSTNNIPFSENNTNYFTLIFSQTKPSLTGMVLMPDGSPAKNCRIIMFHKREWAYANVDETGFFELYGQIEKGETMDITAFSWQDKFSVSTNFLSGTKNVILKLKQPYKIIGKVFLDDLNSPAKNFVIKQYEKKQSYNSPDGSFVFIVEHQRNGINKSGDFIISIDNYLPFFGKFDFTKSSVYNSGNIILKSGETAKIYGRVTDKAGNPINVRIKLQYKEFDKSFYTYSNREDGTFGFEGMPPGKATVSVSSKHSGSVSHNFIINEGDDLELPDLVLEQTNSE